MRYFFALLVLFIIVACNKYNNKKSIIENQNEIKIIKEYAYEEFDLLEENANFRPIFDTIIETVNGCSELSKKELIYYVNVHKEIDSSIRISIDLKYQKDVYCKAIDGVFTYNKAVFVISDSEHMVDLFINTGLKVIYNCQKENILMNDHNDALIGGWDYIVENGSFKCISFGICGKQWINEKYYNSKSE